MVYLVVISHLIPQNGDIRDILGQNWKFKTFVPFREKTLKGPKMAIFGPKTHIFDLATSYMTFLVSKWCFGQGRSIPFAINFQDIAQVLTYQKHSFRGVIAKIGYLRPILAT